MRLKLGILPFAAVLSLSVSASQADAAGSMTDSGWRYHRDDCIGMLVRCHFGHGFDDDFFGDRFERISCAEAKRLMSNRGYRNIKTLRCNGGLAYRFKAQFKGKNYELRVSNRNGALLSVKRVK